MSLKPRLLFAEQINLERLRIEAMLPDNFLHVSTTYLEDTTEEEFKEALQNNTIVALPSNLLDGDINEQLTPGARDRYRQNLRERVRDAHIIKLFVLNKQSNSNWLKELTDFCNSLILENTTVDWKVTCILILEDHATDKFKQQLDDYKKLEVKNGLRKLYLMTDTLEPGAGEIVHARFVWPLAVAKLLTFLGNVDENDQDGSCSIWAWRGTNIGPEINDTEVERTRSKSMRQTIFGDASSGQDIELMPDPGKLTADPILFGSKENADLIETKIQSGVSYEIQTLATSSEPNQESQVIRSVLDVSQTTEGGALLSAGWNTEIENYRVGLLNGEATHLFHTAQSDNSTKQLQHIIKCAHSDSHNINRIISLTTPTAASEEKHRVSLNTLDTNRHINQADSVEIYMAEAELHRALDRHNSLPERLTLAFLTILFVAGLWSAITKAFWVIKPVWTGIISLALFAAVVLGCFAGAYIPFIVEKKKLEAARVAINKWAADDFNKRKQDANFSKNILTPATEKDKKIDQCSAIKRAKSLCERLKYILEQAIEEGQVPTIRLRSLYSNLVPDEDKNLYNEDRREYEKSATSKIPAHPDTPEAKEDGNTDNNAAVTLADKNILATKWKGAWSLLCKLDPDNLGHFSYSSSLPILRKFATEFRNYIWNQVIEERIKHVDELQEETVRDILKSQNLLSVSVTGTPKLEPRIFYRGIEDKSKSYNAALKLAKNVKPDENEAKKLLMPDPKLMTMVMVYQECQIRFESGSFKAYGI